jgi:ribosomal protein S18 acetylase RimI-like enzyme
VSFTVRTITDADIDQVAALHVRTWQVAYAGIVPAETLDGLDPAAFAETRRTRPVPSGATTLVAVEHRTVVGFVSAGPSRDGDQGELYAVYVDPGHWGGGAGSSLFQAAVDHLRGQGFTAMTLWVLEDNDQARRFYERRGMRPDGTRDYYMPRGSSARLPEIRYRTRL